VAGALVALAVCGVAVALATSTGIAASAIVAALAALVSARIMYSEVVQTRRHYARERALQAKSFGRAMADNQTHQIAFTQLMTSRMSEKDRTIRELNGTVRLAEMRADEAEVRVRRESRRATEAQARLSELLDEVLAYQTVSEGAHVAGDQLLDSTDLPTIVDLLAWEDRINEAMVEELRKEA
jgi:predicted transcriptional regulator